MNRLLGLLFIAFSLAGCNPAKQAARKFEKEKVKAFSFFAMNPLLFAENCGRQYPVKGFDSNQVIIKPGKTETRVDSAGVDITDILTAVADFISDSTAKSVTLRMIDSFRKNPYKVPCPPHTCKVSPDSVIVLNKRVEENTAMLEAFRWKVHELSNDTSAKGQVIRERDVSIKDLNATISKKNTKISTLYIGYGIIALLLVVYIVLKVKKVISF